ncbi:MAG: adenosylcobinamide-GDP ribazoletransferase [Lachnospiraceae bacterium]|nr:adenosylcobinamide-GDP ribazoletransferase [Lachnospiraceae bacterium]
MLTWIRALAVAMGRYSRIPMPGFGWNEKDMQYHMMFFPWVGGVISLCSLGGYFGLKTFLPGLSSFVVASLLTVIPLMITGGFHLDGFLDVQDARNSFQSREKKLEILKDPHIGSFAVISLAIYGLLWMGGLVELLETKEFWALGGFFLSYPFVRAIAGILAIVGKKARTSGMLVEEVNQTPRVVLVVLGCTILAIVLGECVFLSPMVILFEILLILCFIWYYNRMCKREFGGVSGDTSGYFVVQLELLLLWLFFLSTRMCS